MRYLRFIARSHLMLIISMDVTDKETGRPSRRFGRHEPSAVAPEATLWEDFHCGPCRQGARILEGHVEACQALTVQKLVHDPVAPRIPTALRRSSPQPFSFGLYRDARQARSA